MKKIRQQHKGRRIRFEFGILLAIVLQFFASIGRVNSQSLSPQPARSSILQSPTAQNQANRSAVSSTSKQPMSLDASLNGCFLKSLDRGWAVGDRGLILVTTDGGKTWLPQDSGVDSPLHAIQFTSDKMGCVAGGMVQDYSRRSSGVILNSSDGGQTWKVNPQSDLPCLTGLRSLGQGHLMAWGDYSPQHRTSLFESVDHGVSWRSTGISLPHLQCSAWGGRQLGIAIDRLSRVYRIDAANQVVNLAIGGDPTRPLLCAEATETGLWIGGTEGQLLHSIDGVRWERLLLPGTEQDRRWMTIQSIQTIGEEVWVAGRPGNVIWHSHDRGRSWEVQQAPPNSSIDFLHAVSVDRLVTVGPMARITGTRNGGRGWWIENNEGDRAGLLNVVSTEGTAAWDALALSTWQHARHAALYISHASHFESKVDMEPDLSSKLSTIRSRVGLAAVRIEPGFAIRQSDLVDSNHVVSYRKSAVGTSEVTMAMVQAIRGARPDVVIIDSQSTEKDLEGANAKAAMEAIEKAADSSFQVFTTQSGIPNASWKTPKVFARSASARSGLNIVPKQILKPGLTLDEVLRPIGALGLDRFEPTPKLDHNYVLLQSPIFNELARREIFGGTIADSKSGRKSLSKGLAANEVLQMQQRNSHFESLLALSGSRFQSDIRWEQELERFLTSEKSSRVWSLLYQGGQDCLASGYWNRWRVITEKLLRDAPSDSVSAEAYRQLLIYVSSAEIRHWLDRMAMQETEAMDNAQNASVAVAKSTPASPFQRGTNSNDEQVRLAGFSDSRDSKLPVKIARNQTELTVIAPNSTDAFPGFVNPKMLTWAQKQMNVYQPQVNLDPRLRVLKLFAVNSTDLSMDGRKASFQDLRDANAIAGWCQVGEQELAWGEKLMSPGALRAYATSVVPMLDGKLDDACWKQGKPALLTDPWRATSLPPTEVFISFDATYVYIAIRASNAQTSDVRSSNLNQDLKKVRSYDSLKYDRDHIMIRLDLDRDYHTWFGFGVDASGELTDECCHWKSWNPRWMVDSRQLDGYWNTEIAIPITEIGSSPIQVGDCWAIDIHRSIPGIGTQSSGRVASDEFLPQGMRMLHFVSPQ